jgi:Holliday junction resolvase RusA-like endonuclease
MDNHGTCGNYGRIRNRLRPWKEIQMNLWINGTLPSLNDYIHAINQNRFTGNKLKKDTQDTILWFIKMAKLQPLNGLYDLMITWSEPSRKRDPDNIYSGVKYILDALQVAGILESDSQKHIRNISNELRIVKCNSGVNVEFIAVKVIEEYMKGSK